MTIKLCYTYEPYTRNHNPGNREGVGNLIGGYARKIKMAAEHDWRCPEHSQVILSLLLRVCIISWNDFGYDVAQTRPQTIFGWLG